MPLSRVPPGENTGSKVFVATDKDGITYFPSELFPPPHYADTLLAGEYYLSAAAALTIHPDMGMWIILTANQAAKGQDYAIRPGEVADREWLSTSEGTGNSRED